MQILAVHKERQGCVVVDVARARQLAERGTFELYELRFKGNGTKPTLKKVDFEVQEIKLESVVLTNAEGEVLDD